MSRLGFEKGCISSAEIDMRGEGVLGAEESE
jgi:hypothetical protein